MRAVSPNLLLLLASCCVWHCCYAVPDPDYDLQIYSGHKINITEAPYMAQIKPHGASYVSCGATIVHEQFVVTAAYCVNSHQVVYVGSDEKGKGEEHKIEKAFIHPKYSPEKTFYDIAVLKLEKKLKFSNRVNLIKMADHSLVPKPGDLMKVAGFGAKEDKKESQHLLGLDMPFVNLTTCRKIYGKHSKMISERMCCAGGVIGKGVCYGDGGGPLVYKDRFIGIICLGYGCATKYPTVFTYIPSFLDFVEGVIKNNTQITST